MISHSKRVMLAVLALLIPAPLWCGSPGLVLSFPLAGEDPYTAVIHTVFDHSMNPALPYASDGVVVAYTGELGQLTNGVNSGICYQNSNHLPFVVNGHYTGACGGPTYLSYEGHPGYDFAASSSVVLAAADGIVIQAVTSFQDNTGQTCKCLGNSITISHGNGSYQTIYGHLKYGSFSSSLLGTSITAGTPIAVTDNTGDSTGQHLHFEVRQKINGKFRPVDPYGWQGQGADPYIALGNGAVVNVALWATGSAVGAITINGTLDNQTAPNSYWNGSVNYTLTGGPSNFSSTQSSLTTFPSLPTGSYTLTETGGGPANATLTGLAPCVLTRGPAPCGQTLTPSGLTFIFQFTSNPPTAGFAMSSGSQSGTDGQTLNLTAPSGSPPTVSFNANTRSVAFNGNRIMNWTWTANGSIIASTSQFSATFPVGTSTTISLVVTDNRGVSSAPVTGTVVVAQSAPPGNGWRMNGYDASRTNISLATGPTTLPTFQPLITSAPSTLTRIGPDGSLLFIDGSLLFSYTNTGVPKWSTSFSQISDAAIGPTGNIFVSSQGSASVTALSPITGLPIWPAPFTSGLNGAAQTGSAPLAIDSSGVIYLNLGVTGELTAINPDGTLKWHNGLSYRSDVSPVLSYDQSVALIPNIDNSNVIPLAITSGFYTATGQPGPGGPPGLQSAAPWGTVYFAQNTLYYAQGLLGCVLGLSCGVTAADTTYLGVMTYSGGSTIVAQVSNPANSGAPFTQGVDKDSGNVLWRITEQLGSVFSDAGGTLFGIAVATNDLVAFNGRTGVQMWRQHFDPTNLPLIAILLGDDGNLYVSAGQSLYKSAP